MSRSHRIDNKIYDIGRKAADFWERCPHWGRAAIIFGIPAATVGAMAADTMSHYQPNAESNLKIYLDNPESSHAFSALREFSVKAGVAVAAEFFGMYAVFEKIYSYYENK